VPPSCRLISRVVPVLVPRAGPAAQALFRSCLVPALALWCRARAVLFRAVPVLAHRAWPIWPSIHGFANYSLGSGRPIDARR
jgi:hypothetical protein